MWLEATEAGNRDCEDGKGILDGRGGWERVEHVWDGMMGGCRVDGWDASVLYIAT